MDARRDEEATLERQATSNDVLDIGAGSGLARLYVNANACTRMKSNAIVPFINTCIDQHKRNRAKRRVVLKAECVDRTRGPRGWFRGDKNKLSFVDRTEPKSAADRKWSGAFNSNDLVFCRRRSCSCQPVALD